MLLNLSVSGAHHTDPLGRRVFVGGIGEYVHPDASVPIHAGSNSKPVDFVKPSESRTVGEDLFVERFHDSNVATRVFRVNTQMEKNCATMNP